jgi:hypothetical protein
MFAPSPRAIAFLSRAHRTPSFRCHTFVAGDVSLFLPVEQAALAETVAARDLTAIFSRYNVAGAIGALASALPAIIAARMHANIVAAERSGFIAYAIRCLWHRGLSYQARRDERRMRPRMRLVLDWRQHEGQAGLSL